MEYCENIFKIDTNEERYIIDDFYFDLDIIYNKIIPLSEKYNKLFSEKSYDKTLSNKYNIKNDPYLNVKTFDDLLKYYRNFIEQKDEKYLYGIRGNTGPLSRETELIKDELLQFYSKGIITCESQPGLVDLYDFQNVSIHKPYVYIIIEKDLLQYLYEFVDSHDMISCIDYDSSQEMNFIKKDFPNLTDLDNYTFEFLGVRHPTYEERRDSEEMKNYFEYIFSNQFFRDITNIF
jgi:hypothetical protein